MAAAGMEHAIVANFVSNAASGALYRSAGFVPWHVLDGYEKPLG
jgi:RimJ/RimL family protein N-acetyltransferase